LRARGLDGVKLAVSDDHLGLKAAIAKVIGCPWQRCTGWIQPVLATPGYQWTNRSGRSGA
jgi:hypothetical protein